MGTSVSPSLVGKGVPLGSRTRKVYADPIHGNQTQIKEDAPFQPFPRTALPMGSITRLGLLATSRQCASHSAPLSSRLELACRKTCFVFLCKFDCFLFVGILDASNISEFLLLSAAAVRFVRRLFGHSYELIVDNFS